MFDLFGKKAKQIAALETQLAETKAASDRLQVEFRTELTRTQKIFQLAYFSHLDNPDEILREKMSGRSYKGYDRMIEQDTHLGAVIETRRRAISDLEWDIYPYIEPGKDKPTPLDERIANEIKWILQDIDNHDEIIANMLMALVHGVSFQEIIWDQWKGWNVIKETKSRYPGNFRFGENGEIYFSEDGYSGGKLIDDYYMLVYTFNKKYENLYGTSLCKTCYWAHFFKTALIRYMMTFSERLGQPAIAGKYPRNWGTTEITDFHEKLKAMKNDSVFVIPEDAAIEMIEAKFRSEGMFRETIEFWNDEQSKRVLGQTLTTGEGRRSGSLALGEVHEEVREDLAIADAKSISRAYTRRIVRPLVQLNFGFNVMTPKFKLIHPKSTDLVKESEVDRNLHGIGLNLSKTQLYEKYDRKQPETEDDTLKGGLSQPALGPGFQLSEATTTRPRFHINGRPAFGPDISILSSIYDDMAKYIAWVYSSIETDLLMTVTPGTPIGGLIDQSVRKYINQDFLGRLTEYSGLSVYKAAQDMARQFGATLADTTFETIKNEYLRDRFYAKGVLDGVADKMRQLLSNQIPDWTSPGINFDAGEMKKLIRSTFKDLKDYRVELIARNEIAEAANHAGFKVIENTGLATQLEAHFLVDPQSCEICQEWASRNPYPIEQARTMGLPHIQCNDQWTFYYKSQEGGTNE